MWMFLDRDIILQIVQVLRSTGDTKIANVISARLRQDTEDAKVDSQYRSAARSVYQVDGELEFDPSAVVSKGEDAGAYVMGWQWVAEEELAGASDRQLQAVDN